MAGKVIGKTLPFGFRGNVSRTPDTIVMPFCAVGDDPIQFGEPVVYDATNKGVRKVASGDTSASIIGIAVRRMGQPYADSADGYYYAKGDTVDVLVRGSMTIELLSATGIAARGKVYVCNGTGSNRPAGSIVAQAASGTGADTIEVPNTVFATGDYDASNIAEVTILTRSI